MESCQPHPINPNKLLSVYLLPSVSVTPFFPRSLYSLFFFSCFSLSFSFFSLSSFVWIWNICLLTFLCEIASTNWAMENVIRNRKSKLGSERTRYRNDSNQINRCEQDEEGKLVRAVSCLRKRLRLRLPCLPFPAPRRARYATSQRERVRRRTNGQLSRQKTKEMRSQECFACEPVPVPLPLPIPLPGPTNHTPTDQWQEIEPESEPEPEPEPEQKQSQKKNRTIETDRGGGRHTVKYILPPACLCAGPVLATRERGQRLDD